MFWTFFYNLVYIKTDSKKEQRRAYVSFLLFPLFVIAKYENIYFNDSNDTLDFALFLLSLLFSLSLSHCTLRASFFQHVLYGSAPFFRTHTFCLFFFFVVGQTYQRLITLQASEENLTHFHLLGGTT